MLRIMLGLATLGCGLVAGFLFAFAVVVMPGIRTLGDHDFLQAFKSVDRVIQQNQPVFMLVWVGSVLALAVAVWWGVVRLEGIDRMLLVGAAVVYLLGVQGPTATVNVPLNNALQQRDLAVLAEPALREARQAFEPRWVRWNGIRTVFAVLAFSLLLIVLMRC
ncbi:DUF1772 domain-containing protein [Synoicihabitans lomoniglobus]|uniref:DUF1772 domain-containing protein n=1 Tax=Synoicihabitans lomoniglobus TaxID=2909285 RepID=A0AAE9ZTQ1_9BACT|nr:DUF1772 domain-containing protein [Opitutaceae bacterium LMO-M01]WED63131.1 DUF1772 domain-containing protein [Opitutaceae bacterium LMO-M01]